MIPSRMSKLSHREEKVVLANNHSGEVNYKVVQEKLGAVVEILYILIVVVTWIHQNY